LAAHLPRTSVASRLAYIGIGVVYTALAWTLLLDRAEIALFLFTGTAVLPVAAVCVWLQEKIDAPTKPSKSVEGKKDG
jgi:hypothetical protein